MQAERKEDMSADGRLELIQQRDGDVIVIVHPDSDSREAKLLPFGASVEFCVSGGRSPRTLHALRDLMAAMIKDSEEQSC